MTNSQKGIIDRREGDFWVIEMTGGQEIYWPRKNVSFDCREGDSINIFLSKNEAETADNENSAKNILKTIFQSNV